MRGAYWTLLHAMALQERHDSSILDATKLSWSACNGAPRAP